MMIYETHGYRKSYKGLMDKQHDFDKTCILKCLKKNAHDMKVLDLMKVGYPMHGYCTAIN